MRFLVCLLVFLTMTFPVAGQRVSVSLSLIRDSSMVVGAPPRVLVSTPGFATDTRWRQLIEEPIPIRMQYRLELWRSRSFNDALERTTEFDILIRLEPLYDQFSATVFDRGVMLREQRLPTLEALGNWLRTGIALSFRARSIGDYYYTVTLTITPLSDSEMEDFERFVQGDADAARRQETTSIGRRLRRGLLSLSPGLRAVQIDTRSVTFTVTRLPKP